MAEGIGTVTGTDNCGKRISDLWGCEIEAVDTKGSVNKWNGE